MPSGIVKWFDDGKGFGFIRQLARDEPDVYVHHTGIAGDGSVRRTLSEGQRVEFEVDRAADKGPRAINVRPAPGAGVNGAEQDPRGVHDDR